MSYMDTANQTLRMQEMRNSDTHKPHAYQPASQRVSAKQTHFMLTG